MTSRKIMDQADQALAEEFGQYISEVAKKIVEPLQEVTASSLKLVSHTTDVAVSRINSLVGDHLEQFGNQSSTLTNSLTALKEEMKEAVATVAEGHERTRAELLAYAEQHARDARDEMKIQTDRLERSFLEAMEPKVQKLYDEVLALFEKSVIEHQQKVEIQVSQLRIGLGVIAVQIIVVGAFIFFLK